MVTNITAQTASTYLTYAPSNFAIFTMIVGAHNKIDPNIYAIAIIFISTTKIPNTFKRKTIEEIARERKVTIVSVKKEFEELCEHLSNLHKLCEK